MAFRGATPKPHALELMKLVELEDAANRKVSTYSGGMRRRLGARVRLDQLSEVTFPR